MYKQLQSPQVHLIIIWTRSVNDENIENMQIQSRLFSVTHQKSRQSLLYDMFRQTSETCSLHSRFQQTQIFCIDNPMINEKHHKVICRADLPSCAPSE